LSAGVAGRVDIIKNTGSEQKITIRIPQQYTFEIPIEIFDIAADSAYIHLERIIEKNHSS
jgi:hypothetical protein